MKKIWQYLCDETEYKMDARKKAILLWSGIIVLCANGYGFVNYMPKHDAINHMFSSSGEWEVRLGRFLQPYYTQLRGNIVSPWLVGIIGAAFAVLSVFIIVDILNIENHVCAILASGFLLANLSVTELCGIYIYIYDCCMIALFMSCLSVWCWLHIRKPWNIILGSISLVISMGLYQAFISVAIVLCVVVLLKKALANESWKKEIYSAFTMILMIALGCIVYLILYKIVLFIWNTTPTDGSNGMQRLTELSLPMLFQNLFKTYKDVMNFFVTDSRYFGGIVCTLHGVLLLITVIGFVLLLLQKKIKDL